MLYFNRIDIYEGFDVNKTSASKEYDISHYWYILYYNFKFQPNASNRCRYLLIMSMKLSGIAILSIKVSDWPSIISLISKNAAINIMQNADLNEKKRTLQSKNKYKHF